MIFLSLLIAVGYILPVLSLNIIRSLARNDLHFPEKSILVLGNSLTECAINDSIYSKAVNFSHSATDYLYNYAKLRFLLKTNPQVEKVILGLSYHDMLVEREDWITDPAHVRKYLPAYSICFGKQELHDLFQIKPQAVISSIPRIPFYNIFTVVKRITKGKRISNFLIGGFKKLKRNKLETAIKKHKQRSTSSPRESRLETEYLARIVEVCQTNEVELIFLITPVHHEFYDQQSKKYIEHHNDYLKSHFNDQTLIDHSKFPIPDSGFADLFHLNFEGANIYSKYLKTLDL